MTLLQTHLTSSSTQNSKIQSHCCSQMSSCSSSSHYSQTRWSFWLSISSSSLYTSSKANSSAFSSVLAFLTSVSFDFSGALLDLLWSVLDYPDSSSLPIRYCFQNCALIWIYFISISSNHLLDFSSGSWSSPNSTMRWQGGRSSRQAHSYIQNTKREFDKIIDFN